MEHIALLRAFGVLNRTFLAYFSAKLSPYNLSYSEGIILANLGADREATQQSLAAALVIDRAAVARALKSLSRKGFVRSERSAADARVNRLFVTADGEALLSKIAVWNRDWIAHATQDLSERESEVFERAVLRVRRRVESAPEEEGVL